MYEEKVKNKLNIDDFNEPLVSKKIIAIYSTLGKRKIISLDVYLLPNKNNISIINYTVMEEFDYIKTSNNYKCYYCGASLHEAIEVYNKL